MSKTTDSISSTCVLCCGSIKFYAVGPCNHHICLKCSTRMRVLCEQKYCSVCRAEMPKVVATVKLHPYDGIISHKFPVDRKAGIAFANSSILQEFYHLLHEICHICKGFPEKNFKALQDHMRKNHELFYCDLCIKHLKVFPFERKTYTRKDLALHRRKGDGKDTSYRGHPLCEFCDDRFFDNDELLRHLRRQHYFCHFCETDGVSHQYYSDYDNLKEHFSEQHYLCEEDRCAQEQFTHVFRTSIDLKAHKATAHTSQMSRAQARQMRHIDVEINLPPRPSDRGGVGGGGPSFVRGRDRRYQGNRDGHLETALQASMETSRREAAERRETTRQDREERGSKARQDREERESKRSKDNPQTKKKSSAKTEDASSEGNNTSKPRTESKQDAVATETVEREAATTNKERRVKKKGGRTSPEEKVERKVEEETTKKTAKTSENVTDERKVDSDVVAPKATVKEMGKKKKNKNKASKTDADTDADAESAPLQSSKKPADDKPSETSWTFDVRKEDYPPIGNEADLKSKSTTLAWTGLNAKAEDFPALGGSGRPSAGSTGAVGGFNFYSALQKVDTQPKPQKQPVAMPAQRSFQNKDDDFPTLSSIAGILGVEPAAPSQTNQQTKSQKSAWTAPKDKTTPQPEEPKQGASKSKKKGKKFAKEPRGVVVSESKQSLPPGLASHKIESAPSAPQGKKAVVPQRTPPGLPPGLSLKVSAPSTVQPEPPATAAASNPISPPPGFGVSVSMSNGSLPPGFDVYIHPSNFQERNLTLASQIKAFLDNQETKFDMFRSISRRFRDGSTTAADYYHQCRVLLGDNLPKIFNELVSLLPDVMKQQELLAAQNDFQVQERHQKDNNILKTGKSEPSSTKAKGRGSGAWKSAASANCSCPQCGQTMERSELQGHLNMHRDFPSLSTSSVSKQQPIGTAASAWQQIK